MIKNEAVYRDRVYFGAKLKSYNATMKRDVKEHLLRMSDMLKKKISCHYC